MKNLLLLYLIIVMCASCTNKSSKFVGIWKNLLPRQNGWNIRNQELVIENVGKNFTVQASDWDDGKKKKLAASYSKEFDKLIINFGIINIDVLYNPDTKHLLVDGQEYVKQSDSGNRDITTANTSTPNQPIQVVSEIQPALITPIKINEDISYPEIQLANTKMAEDFNLFMLHKSWGETNYNMSNLRQHLKEDAQGGLQTIAYIIKKSTSTALVIDLVVCFGGAGVHCSSSRFTFNPTTGAKEMKVLQE